MRKALKIYSKAELMKSPMSGYKLKEEFMKRRNTVSLKSQRKNIRVGMYLIPKLKRSDK